MCTHFCTFGPMSIKYYRMETCLIRRRQQFMGTKKYRLTREDTHVPSSKQHLALNTFNSILTLSECFHKKTFSVNGLRFVCMFLGLVFKSIGQEQSSKSLTSWWKTWFSSSGVIRRTLQEMATQSNPVVDVSSITRLQT